MPNTNAPCSGSSEASSFLRRTEDLRRFLDDIIRVASRAKSLLESCRGPLEACNLRVQPPTDSASRSPCCAYSFCFFCGQKGHIRANCDSCKEYLAAGKCLLVKGRIVLPTGQEIPREVPGRTLKDRLDSWDLGSWSNDIRIPPSSPGWLISLEDVGSQMPQTQMISLGVSQPRLSVRPNTPSEQPLCAPLSAEGPSHRSVPVQPQGPIRTPSASSNSSDALLCRPHSPTRVLPTGYSRGRPRSRSYSRGQCQSRSRSRDRGRPYSPSRSYFESSPSCGHPRSPSRSHAENSPGRGHRHQYLYSSRLRSRDSRDYRDEPTLVRQLDRVVTASSYSNQSSRSIWEPVHSGRRYSRSRTPQPSRRVY